MGANFRFVHCADLHLGARFKGVSEKDPKAAERMRMSVFESFSRIVDRVIDSRADALFIAGDAFDESTLTPSTRMFLVDELVRAKVPVFLSRGNHDPHTSWEESIPMPPNVHEFGTEPERVDIPGVEGAEAVGASFADWHDERNIPSMLRGSPDRFTVACVHCDVDAVDAEYSYSPCSLSDLRGRGVDYWAIGHIHKRAVLSEDPWVVYPGNIQGRSFKETGEKGAYLVEVRDGRVASAEFFATQGIVWYDEVVDIAGKDMASITDDLRRRIAPGSIVRLAFVGSGEMDRMLREQSDNLRSLIGSRIGCTISEFDIRTVPPVDIDARRGGKDMIGLVIGSGDSLKGSGRNAILSKLSSNPVMARNLESFEYMTDDELDSIVDEAVMAIVSRLGVAR